MNTWLRIVLSIALISLLAGCGGGSDVKSVKVVDPVLGTVESSQSEDGGRKVHVQDKQGGRELLIETEGKDKAPQCRTCHAVITGKGSDL